MADSISEGSLKQWNKSMFLVYLKTDGTQISGILLNQR